MTRRAITQGVIMVALVGLALAIYNRVGCACRSPTQTAHMMLRRALRGTADAEREYQELYGHFTTSTSRLVYFDSSGLRDASIEVATAGARHYRAIARWRPRESVTCSAELTLPDTATTVTCAGQMPGRFGF
jgi:hypothetical protein